MLCVAGHVQIWQKSAKASDPDSISQSIRLQQLLYGSGQTPGGGVLPGDAVGATARATATLKKSTMGT